MCLIGCYLGQFPVAKRILNLPATFLLNVRSIKEDNRDLDFEHK